MMKTKSQQKKKLALVFGTVLFIGALSGCGNAPQKGSEQDYEEAEETLEQFIDAVLDGDERTVKKISDYKSGIPWTAVNRKVSAEEAQSLLESDASWLTLPSQYKAAVIEEGEQDIEIHKYYNAFLDYLKKSKDPEYTEYLESSPDITYIYSFTVSLSDKYDKIFDVAKIDGKWKVLLGWVDDMREASQATLESANTIAKRIYNACNTALVDMDTTDMYLPEEGIMKLNGSDFFLEKPDSSLKMSDPEYIRQYFLCAVAGYYPRIVYAGEIRIEIKNGACSKVAIHSGGDPYTGKKGDFYGCYPDEVTEEMNKKAKSIDDII